MSKNPKYRPASEKTIKAGKGKSTDELSFKDALEYFQNRGKETGSKKFRYKGEVYDLSGKKVEKSAPAKTEDKPSTRPKANPTRKPGGARPEGKAAGMPAGKDSKKSESPGKRGEVSPGVVAAMGAGAIAAGVAASRSGRGNGKAETARRAKDTKPYNPTYSGRGKAPEGFQGRMKTDVAKPAVRGGTRAIGGNPAADLRGGRIVKMPDVLELQFMNKGGMVKKPAKTYKK